MRVIGGIFRSRILHEVDTHLTRETKDRVKESIFNTLQPYLYDAHVLDLYAGSGSLGIEAISRNAAHVTMVDQHYAAITTIKRNCDMLDIHNAVTIHQGDATVFLHSTAAKYDIILLDPPYQEQQLDEIISIIATRKILQPNGIIVCLYGKNDTLSQENHGIMEYKTKTMGITKVTYMKWGT